MLTGFGLGHDGVQHPEVCLPTDELSQQGYRVHSEQCLDVYLEVAQAIPEWAVHRLEQVGEQQGVAADSPDLARAGPVVGSHLP